jgi:hypothetical protein
VMADVFLVIIVIERCFPQVAEVYKSGTGARFNNFSSSS